MGMGLNMGGMQMGEGDIKGMKAKGGEDSTPAQPRKGVKKNEEGRP
jgi:hypothetical protein